MNSLDAARAEAVKSYIEQSEAMLDPLHFKNGWDACIAHLENLAGEFDEKALEARLADTHFIGPLQYDGFVRGARWQYEQDRARIVCADSLYKSTFASLIEANDKIKDLEAKLAEMHDTYLNNEHGGCR